MQEILHGKAIMPMEADRIVMGLESLLFPYTAIAEAIGEEHKD